MTAVCLAIPSAWSQTPPATNGNAGVLRKLSIEELMGLKVTSVSRKQERLSETAAAVTVITADDIRRSGVTDIPDALRLSPGVDVARVDSHEWAVGVRGLNDTFTSSLLTLIDGRSIYTPLFAGTFWDANDVLLEDIDRIEVVRGPGSTVWGANAFNGVVNIVTKPASETQGLLVTGGGGTEHSAMTAVQYGGKLSEDTFYRVYGKYDIWDDLRLFPSGDATDGWSKNQGGFRIDSQGKGPNRLTLQGDFYSLTANQEFPQISLTPPSETAAAGKWRQFGGNLLGRWTHDFSSDSDLSVQAFYSGDDMRLPILHDAQHVFDLDVRHRFQLGRQEFVWGGGARATLSHFDNSIEMSVGHQQRLDEIGNIFVQDEITLLPDKLHFTAGTKLEYNNLTGLETEPGARLAWTPTEHQTVWISVSRAVRTPSIFESDGQIRLAVLPASATSGPIPAVITFAGFAQFQGRTVNGL